MLSCWRSHGKQFVNSFARRQHLFDITATPIDVDSNFLSHLAPLFLFHFRPNIVIMLVVVITCRKFGRNPFIIFAKRKNYRWHGAEAWTDKAKTMLPLQHRLRRHENDTTNDQDRHQKVETGMQRLWPQVLRPKTVSHDLYDHVLEVTSVMLSIYQSLTVQCYASAAYRRAVCLSVRPSVHSWTLSKRINIFNFSHHRVATSF